MLNRILLSLFFTSIMAFTSRGGYRIDISTVDCGAVTQTSSTYRALGRVLATQLFYPSSSQYSAKIGFYASVYLATLNPLVTSISPSTGYNIAPILINRIAGANFNTGVTVALQKTGEDNIAAYDVSLTASSEINCRFDLAGKTIGLWDVVVTNTDGAQGVLPSGFEIKTYPFSADLAINSPNPFDPWRESTTIMYKLGEDADIKLYLLTTTADLVWSRNYAAGANGGRQGDNSLKWDGRTDFGEIPGNGVLLLRVVNIRSGKVVAKGKIAILRR